MITPVLLSGGAGTRLWPLSRRSYPKQFVPLTDAQTLFQASALRLTGPDFAAPLVVTGEAFRFVVGEQLAAVNLTPGALLIEPAPRNTAPAILAAALLVAREDPETPMLVAPSDHVIPDAARFTAAVAQAMPAARAGALVTFGIAPTRPETGYGYLELAGPPAPTGAAPLARFVEKPNAAQAAEMLAHGGYLWNAGIFLFTARTILEAFGAHAADLIAPVTAALDGAQTDLGFLRLAPEPWATARDVSIDYAVMERASGLAVVPYGGAWSDLGDWNAVWQALGPDAAGVATAGPATALDCADTLLHADPDGPVLVGLGLSDVVAVSTPDAVLVADRRRTQEVRRAVHALQVQGAPQADSARRDHRPWGFFETLASGPRFQVKRIQVKPGAALSLQSHVHRAEHWVVVAGTARVEVDGQERLLTENQSIYVPLGAVHRLSNPGKLPVTLIEVQTGAYVGEDDIVRYEDRYARG